MPAPAPTAAFSGLLPAPPQCGLAMAEIASAVNTELQPSLQLLEHINLNIPHGSVDTVRAFFEAIGAAHNPTGSVEGRQLHFNVGVSQFHLPYVTSVTAPAPVLPHEAQSWQGTIEMVTTEDPGLIAKRLEDASPELARCVVGLREINGRKILALRCPWEVLAECDEVAPSEIPKPSAATLIICRGAHMSTSGPALETKVRSCQGHDGGMGKLIAMTKVIHQVRPGAAECLLRFFTDVLGCTGATLTRSMSSTSKCSVPFLSDAGAQTLVFCESPHANQPDAYDLQPQFQYHLALYLPSVVQFSKAFMRAEQLGVIYVNKRFEGGPPEFASSTTLQGAMASGQFRVKNLIHPVTGELGLTLELEVRSPTHQCFPFASVIPAEAIGSSTDFVSSEEGSESDRSVSLSPSTPRRRRRSSHSRSDIALAEVAMSPPGSPSLTYQQQQQMVSLLMTAGSPQTSPSRSALPMSPLHRAHLSSSSETDAIPTMIL